MRREPDSSAAFGIIHGLLNIPYTGFTTFQHFEGEPLFTDGLDGWAKEYYPLHPSAHIGGNGQGYHPHTRIAYIRICWKDLEPEDGIYDFSLVDEALAKCRAAGQHMMFRLMPHCTRFDQDIPAWLAARIPHPERPVTARVKESPDAPEFYERFALVSRKLGEHIDGDPTLMAVDYSLSGAWGEGHNVDFVPDELIYPLVDAYTEGFARTPLLGQIIRPDLIHYANRTHPTGFRCDCLGDMKHHMIYYYPRNIARMPDVWQKAPVAFESCWTMAHWMEQGTDVDYVIEQSLKWHISTFNNKSSSCPSEWESSVRYWLEHMGYRYAIRLVDFPARVGMGDTAVFGMWLENRGVAPLYNFIPFSIRLRNDSHEYVFETKLNPLTWLPGDNMERFEIELTDVAPGHYALEMGLTNAAGTTPLAELATDAPHDGSFYRIAELEVTK